jgi:hypothetical protein
VGPPVPFIGFDPTDHPGRLPAQVEEGGAGGANIGLVLRPVRGVSIAFGQAWNTELPLWQCLQELGPHTWNRS